MPGYADSWESRLGPVEDHSRIGKASHAGSALVVAAAAVVVLAGIKAASDIVVPIILAIFVATLTGPAVLWMHSKRVPKLVAIATVVMAVAGFLLLVGNVTASFYTELSRNLPQLQEELEAQIDPIRTSVVELVERMGLETTVEDLSPGVDLPRILGGVGSALLQAGNIITKAVLAVLIMLFMLAEGFHLETKVRRALGTSSATWAGLVTFAESVQKYLFIKTMVSLLTGFLAGTAVWLLGVDYAAFWGMLAFLLNFVPNVGSIIAGTPAVVMALVQQGLGTAILVTLAYLAINVIVGGIVEPKFMGDGIGLSPLVVVVSLVFWGWMLGAVGMLLSTPLTMSVKIALDNVPDSRWISVMLGSAKR